MGSREDTPFKSYGEHVKKKKNRLFVNPFLNFMQDFNKEMQGRSKLTVPKLGQMAGERWREMTPNEIMPYLKLAEKARALSKRRKKAEITRKHKVKKTVRKGRKSDKSRDHRIIPNKLSQKLKECTYCGSLYKHTKNHHSMSTGTSASASFSSSSAMTADSEK